MSAGGDAAGWVAAIDLGATSGRVMLGRVGPDELSVEVVHRFPNEGVRVADGLHWNVLELYRQVLVGLAKAVAAQPGLRSVGIDSWAVDYALLAGDRMVSSPYHYRDARTERGVDRVHRAVSQGDLYAASGLQFLPFNTVYQLAVDAADDALTPGVQLLLIPDLLGFWLTGVKVAERTNASTTGLLELGRAAWNADLIARLQLPSGLLPPLLDAGSVVGPLSEEVLAMIGGGTGNGTGLPLVAVGSHDTASAVVAVPMTDRQSAYISSGTWSLVGVELDEPVLSDPTFTNEGGVDGRVRYLRNVMGLWLLSESVRTWERTEQVDLTDLLAAAANLTEPVATFDANHPSLVAPGDIPARITALCTEAGATPPQTPVEFVRSICESLAAAYASTLTDLERLTGRRLDTVHVVGGGSQNALLCQLTAQRTGRRVLAGPVEATAIGNVLVQARTAGLVHGSLDDLRGLVARSFPPVTYQPHATHEENGVT